MSLVVAGVALLAALWIAAARARQTVVRMEATGKLKQVGLTIMHYERREGRLPWENYDAQGNQLLSWRVHLLPTLNQQELYDRFKFDEPWDSPHNQKLLAQMPEVYKCPSMSDHPNDKTVYLMPIGLGTLFGSSSGESIDELAQRDPDRILLLEVHPDRAVPWTKPIDYSVDFNDPARGLGGHEPEQFLAVFLDGSARPVRTTESPHELARYFEANSE
ncbi:MAG: DUF1559 domain-containing protein [Pirellulales bacterium]